MMGLDEVLVRSLICCEGTRMLEMTLKTVVSMGKYSELAHATLPVTSIDFLTTRVNSLKVMRYFHFSYRLSC